MNWRGGFALIRNTWLSWVQHRGFFFLLAFMWMVPPLIYLFVWMTAAGETGVGGFSRGEFVAYYLVLIVVNQLTYAQTNWTVGDFIRYGNMNILLMRPISPIFDALAQEIAGKVVYMIFILPFVLVLGLVLRPEIHVTQDDALQFVLALALAWALRFFWGYWIALLAFWATQANALLAVQDSLIFLLAGQVAPTALLPGFLRQAAVVLPFRYMIGFPVEVLTGQLNAADIQTGFAFQTGWLVVTVILFALIWRAGVKQYSAVGG
jgi:ABC-2 type transport system permease protein